MGVVHSIYKSAILSSKGKFGEISFFQISYRFPYSHDYFLIVYITSTSNSAALLMKRRTRINKLPINMSMNIEVLGLTK